ncbi:hypothetical protein INR49_001123 [Caranx melampygus]|nr:hypothetical protein INR49_001123 [Caranx melampygus]
MEAQGEEWINWTARLETSEDVQCAVSVPTLSYIMCTDLADLCVKTLKTVRRERDVSAAA